MNIDLNEIKKFAILAHGDQIRDDGTPYWMHLQRVADILIRNNISDPEILATAWLHDVVEDTDVTFRDLVKIASDNTVELVAQLTNKHPHGTSFSDKQSTLLDHAKSMSSSAKLVKLADRLDNIVSMRSTWDEKRQNRYINSTIELLAALRPIPNSGVHIYNEIVSICEGYNTKKPELVKVC